MSNQAGALPEGGPARATAAAARMAAPSRYRSFPAPTERGAQVVDLDLGLLEALLIITACRRVKQDRHRRVAITVPRPQGIGLTGLAEFSAAYWRTVSNSR